jgi:hypothetical protein
MLSLRGAAAIFLVAACGHAHAAQDARRTVEEALAILDARLSSMVHVDPSDLAADPGSAAFRAAYGAVRAKQCSARNPNPLVVVSIPDRVSLHARVEKGELQVPDSGIDISVRVSSVAGLPAEYLRQTAARAESAGRGSPEAVERQPGQNLLEGRVSWMIATYDAASCHGRPQIFSFPPSF